MIYDATRPVIFAIGDAAIGDDGRYESAALIRFPPAIVMSTCEWMTSSGWSRRLSTLLLELVYILILPRCPLRRRNPSGQSMGILLLSISEDFNDSAIGDMLNV